MDLRKFEFYIVNNQSNIPYGKCRLYGKFCAALSG